MKKRKRLTASLLVLVMAAGMCLSACSGSSEEDSSSSDGGTTTIQFWCHTNEAWNNTYRELFDKFEEENPEYKVEMTDYPYADYNQKIQTSLTPDAEGADLYQMWGGWELDFASTGGLEPLPDDLKETLEEDYFEPTYQAYEYGGEYYGIPTEFNLEYGGMVVNKPLFEENNLEYPTTWEELRSVSDQLVQSDGSVITMRGFDFIDEDALIYNYLAMILQQGGQYLNEDGSINLATPEGITAMEELKSMVDAGYTDFSSFSAGVGTSSYVFEGKGSMASVGSWAISDGEESYDLTIGEDFDYVAVPQYGDEMAFVAESGWGLAVPANAKEKDGAWELVRFLSDPENLKELNLGCQQLPPRKTLAEDQEMMDAMPNTAFLMDILEGGQWIGPYNTTTLKETLTATFRDICENGTDIETALTECSETMSAEMIEKE